MKHHTTPVTHPAHDRLLQLKLQAAEHLARVLETHPSDAMRLKAALALARLAIPAQCHRPPADGAVRHSDAQLQNTPKLVTSPTPNSPSLREGAGGRVGDDPKTPDAPKSSEANRSQDRVPTHPNSAPLLTRPQPAPPPGRIATPQITPHTPRPEIFNAPAKPLATACFERLGIKFP